MGDLLSRLLAVFWSKRLECVLVGLDNSGKTTLCNQLALGEAGETSPTVGLNVRVLSKNRVTFKVWDIGGQQRYRQEWPRYTQGCDVIIFVVDANDPDRLDEARGELHQLLECREATRIPVLVLANKIDLGPKLSESEVIKGLNLDYITENAWMVIPISAKEGTHIDQAVEFLTKYGH